MSRVVLTIVLIVLLDAAQAVICKQVDAQGVVSYSDLPPDECASPVQLPDYSRYAPRPIGAPPFPTVAAPKEEESEEGEVFSGYTEMRIEQPANESSFWNNEGKVPVAIFLAPRLQPGHKVQIFLDGKSSGPPFGSLAATLTNVDRGTHELSVRLLDENGTVLREAGPITFTLHRASVNRTANTPGQNGASEGDDTGSSDSAFGPATSGKTHPAFAPNYEPSQ